MMHSSKPVARFLVRQQLNPNQQNQQQQEQEQEQEQEHWPFSLVLTHGSIVEFQHPRGAIVNAANELCLGGGGVDGCISEAGGGTLHQHRLALPLEEGDRCRRCRTGNAKITGPGRYGSLGVDYVIHAVGPRYGGRGNEAADSVNDGLLRSAYRESMVRAKEQRLEAVAFSLLSAGIFRGHRSLVAVLRIGLEAICEFEGYEELKEVHLYGFEMAEIDLLQRITNEIQVLERKYDNYATNCCSSH